MLKIVKMLFSNIANYNPQNKKLKCLKNFK